MTKQTSFADQPACLRLSDIPLLRPFRSHILRCEFLSCIPSVSHLDPSGQHVIPRTALCFHSANELSCAEPSHAAVGIAVADCGQDTFADEFNARDFSIKDRVINADADWKVSWCERGAGRSESWSQNFIPYTRNAMTWDQRRQNGKIVRDLRCQRPIVCRDAKLLLSHVQLYCACCRSRM